MKYGLVVEVLPSVLLFGGGEMCLWMVLYHSHYVQPLE